MNDKPTETSVEDAIRAADKAEDELEQRKLKKIEEANDENQHKAEEWHIS